VTCHTRKGEMARLELLLKVRVGSWKQGGSGGRWGSSGRDGRAQGIGDVLKNNSRKRCGEQDFVNVDLHS